MPLIDHPGWIGKAPVAGVENSRLEVLRVTLIITPHPHIVYEGGAVGVTPSILVAPGTV